MSAGSADPNFVFYSKWFNKITNCSFIECQVVDKEIVDKEAVEQVVFDQG